MRDVPFTQDMGRKARRYSVSAYLVGNDYMSQRDRLLTALEQGGSATLIHPFYGAVTVNVDGEIKVQHNRDNGGMCTISLQFVEACLL
ncbi:DNA circularization protein, partial [Klebsiella pneumoniae]